MGRWPLVGVFSLIAALASVTAVEATEHALSGISLHGSLVAVYALLRAGLVASFTLFVVMRGPALRRSRDPVAFISCAAAIGSLAAFGGPASSSAPGLVIAGELIAVVSCGWLLWAALVLGRCFGVLPEARGLVMSGPYRFVRHPMYLGELGACLGLFVASPGVLNLCLSCVFAIAQGIRMRLEERALTNEFPSYAGYAARTARLIPGVGSWRTAREQMEVA